MSQEITSNVPLDFRFLLLRGHLGRIRGVKCDTPRTAIFPWSLFHWDESSGHWQRQHLVPFLYCIVIAHSFNILSTHTHTHVTHEHTHTKLLLVSFITFPLFVSLISFADCVIKENCRITYLDRRSCRCTQSSNNAKMASLQANQDFIAHKCQDAEVKGSCGYTFEAPKGQQVVF